MTRKVKKILGDMPETSNGWKLFTGIIEDCPDDLFSLDGRYKFMAFDTDSEYIPNTNSFNDIRTVLTNDKIWFYKLCDWYKDKQDTPNV